jgi:hypothetical protein
LIVLAGLVCGMLPASDGRCEDVQYQTWIDYNPNWKKGEHLLIYGDAGVRRNFEDPRSWRFVLRPNVGYHFGSWMITGGIGNFYTDYAGELRLYELRPWQGALVYWPASGLRLSHLFRLEERFFFDADDGNSLFRMRLRYQIGTRVKWTESGSGRGWNSPFSIEAFFMFDKQAEDRFGEEARITAGIARAFSPKLRLEFDLLWQSTARLTEFYSDRELFFRLRFFQSF